MAEQTIEQLKDDILRMRREKIRARALVLNLEIEEHNALDLMKLMCQDRVVCSGEEDKILFRGPAVCVYDDKSHKTCNVCQCPMFSVVENAAGRQD